MTFDRLFSLASLIALIAFAAPAAEPSANFDGLAAELNLPAPYVLRLRQRAVLDQYASRFHVLAASLPAEGTPPVSRYRANDRAARVVQPVIADNIQRYRLALGHSLHPLRGFRAPILDEAADLRPAALDNQQLNPVQLIAADFIRQHLAAAGLLATFARTVEILGPAQFLTNNPAAVRQLWAVGFPVDWLNFFAFDTEAPRDPATAMSQIARELISGKSAAELSPQWQRIPFLFKPTADHFRAAAETGGDEIGLIRLQIGGGYDRGLVRGESLDVAGQLVAALPEADFLMSLPEEYLANIRWLALQGWPLRRANRLTLVSEKYALMPWAQDNGKAGSISAPGQRLRPATLAPRYASQDEVNSKFYPSESFLMDGLRASGHTVLQSPLLFQGGDLLVIHEPQKKRRLLLLSETELYRNCALGLTATQALAAFRLEFGVDDCIVLPAVSYHLDYDVTVRLHQGQLIAFVNDALAAARLIVETGAAVLQRQGVLPTNALAEIHENLGRDRAEPVVRRLWSALEPFRNEENRYRTNLASFFRSDRTESAEYNLQCFLASLDLLASSLPASADRPPDPLAAEYFEALRQLQIVSQTQHDQLAALGWKVVRVPSMPDLYRTVNYLNGLHAPGRFVMPVLGGWFAPLDDAAAAVFQRELGPDVVLIRISSAGLQRLHGAVHCVAAAYPTTRARE